MNGELETFDFSSIGPHEIVVVKVKSVNNESAQVIINYLKSKGVPENNILIMLSGFEISKLTELEMNQMGWYRKATTEQVKP